MTFSMHMPDDKSQKMSSEYTTISLLRTHVDIYVYIVAMIRRGCHARQFGLAAVHSDAFYRLSRGRHTPIWLHHPRLSNRRGHAQQLGGWARVLGTWM